MANKKDSRKDNDKESDLQADIEAIETLKRRLAKFFEYNTHAEIGKRGKYFYVLRPWNDDSVAFVLRPESESIQTLNSLILPPRFTAIYHRDSKTMEYIYTVLENDDPCCKRKFKFVLSGKSYLCRFGEASKELLILSKQFRRTGKQTSTDHRNLFLLREYVQFQSRKRGTFEESPVEMEPISFYVSGFRKFEEDEIIEVSKHLNFYMEYYDRESPHIVIHSPETETFTQARLPETVFPETITAKRQDPFLLDLVLTANITTTARLKFIYYYQILEYSAFYYIDLKTRFELLRIINSPDIQANADLYIPRILETINILAHQEEEAKIENLVKSVCSPEAVWREIEPNKSYFTISHKFDGGFVLEPLISENLAKEEFCGMWHPKTINILRHIRNALVHGREKKFISVIAPTRHNDELLRPWSSLAQCIAEQTILFGTPT